MSKITIDTDFWKEIGKKRHQGIQDFGSKNNLKMKTVTAAAIFECFNEKSSKTIKIAADRNPVGLEYKFSLSKIIKYRSGFRRLYLFYALILLSFLPVSFAVYRIIGADKKIVVGQQSGIPAYHQIAATEIKSLHPFRTANEVGGDDPFVGRYTLKELLENSVVKETDLLETELNKEMANRVILQIPLKSENVGSSVSANSKIGLLFSPNQPASGKSAVIKDIILLGVEKKESNTILTVAMGQEQFLAAQDLLAVSTVYLINN